MAKWYEEAIFYHIYPLGLLGAPKTHTEDGVTTGYGSWTTGCGT